MKYDTKKQEFDIKENIEILLNSIPEENYEEFNMVLLELKKIVMKNKKTIEEEF